MDANHVLVSCDMLRAKFHAMAMVCSMVRAAMLVLKGTHTTTWVRSVAVVALVCGMQPNCRAAGEHVGACVWNEGDRYSNPCHRNAPPLTALPCEDGFCFNTGPGAAECKTYVFTVSTLAGSSSTGGFADGVGLSASFNEPQAVAVHPLDHPGGGSVVYVGDVGNRRIRKILPDGSVSTFAGSGGGTMADGIGTSADFGYPRHFAFARDGTHNLYVTDYYGNAIRRVTPDGTVSTVAGSQSGTGHVDGLGASAEIQPWCLWVDSSETIWVTCYSQNRIRKIVPAASWTVTTWAGSGAGAHHDNVGTAASFKGPLGITGDDVGNLFVNDGNNHRIRRIAPDRTVTTIAGNTQAFSLGVGPSAEFSTPNGIVMDSHGNLVVCDYENQRIRKVTTDGKALSVFAGSGGFGWVDGVGTNAAFRHPNAVALDREGNMYVTEFLNHRVRKLTWHVEWTSR